MIKIIHIPMSVEIYITIAEDLGVSITKEDLCCVTLKDVVRFIC